MSERINTPFTNEHFADWCLKMAEITALEERQSAAIAKKEKTAKEIARRKARRQEIELHFQRLREMDLLTEFRDEDWISMVDHVTVHAKGDIWVTFRDGSEIKAGTSNG